MNRIVMIGAFDPLGPSFSMDSTDDGLVFNLVTSPGQGCLLDVGFVGGGNPAAAYWNCWGGVGINPLVVPIGVPTGHLLIFWVDNIGFSQLFITPAQPGKVWFSSAALTIGKVLG